MNQEIEDCINMITGALTKLRVRIRKLGMAGTEPIMPGARRTGKTHLSEDAIRIAFAEKVERWGQPDPDLPLKARVAKALGWHIYWNKNFEDWFISPYKDTLGVSVESDCYQYDTDLVAAMGALEEYCKQVGQPAHIVYNPDPVTSMGNKAFHVEINFKGRFGDTLPRAICEAIAKHAETQ